MTIYEKMNAINKEAQGKLKPDLLKIGNNFRAVSEAQLYDVLNPLLEEHGVFYEIELLGSEIKEFAVNEGSNRIHRFYATVQVRLTFRSFAVDDPSHIKIDGFGMGIDDGDKCAGKAYTYAVKYALMKAFRLKFSDDSDYSKSETLIEAGDQPAEIPQNERGHGKKVADEEKKKRDVKKKAEEDSRPRISDKMAEYIFGLCKRLNLSDNDFNKKFGCYPSDPNIPMDVARNIIDELKKMEKEALPF